MTLRSRAFRATTLVAFAWVFGLGACARDTTPPRTLLIGMDGATLRIVDPMIASGRMPNLAKIRQQGVSGPLQSFPPYLSPRVWTTVATGKTPPHHGIGNWVKPPGPDGKSELFYGYDRRGKALWNIVSDAGMKVGVVNWLVTYPPEIIDGVMVTDHTFAADVEGQAYIGQVFAEAAGWKFDPTTAAKKGAPPVFPPEWLPRVLGPAKDPLVTPDPFAASVALPNTAPRAALSGFFNRDHALTSIALDIDAELQPRLLMVLLQGVDRVSHYLFGCQDDPATYPSKFQPSPAEVEGCRRALLDYYAYTDSLIGKLVARFEDDDLVIVVSDHGFEAGFLGFNLTGDHTRDTTSRGIVFARGKGVPRGAPAGDVTVNDIAPTVLAWLGLPIAADMDGRPAAFLSVNQREPVATYDTEPVKRLEGAHSGEEGHVIEQLKQLGYVD